VLVVAMVNVSPVLAIISLIFSIVAIAVLVFLMDVWEFVLVSIHRCLYQYPNHTDAQGSGRGLPIYFWGWVCII